VPVAVSLFAGTAHAAGSDPPPTPFVYLHCYDFIVPLLDHTPVVTVCSPLTG
jgi:hypothetical protein